MQANQIQILRSSFARVASQPDLAGALFYDKLFERDPSVSSLFRNDMGAQSRRLMEMIADALLLLDKPEQLDAVLRILGTRHLTYGVRDDHYETVGQALIDTLAIALASDFTPETRQAWAAFYEQVSRVMREGVSKTT